MKEILLILTGGTICSFGDENNENRDADTKRAKRLLLANFEASDSKYVNETFDVKEVLNILSENFTVNKWNELISFLKTIDYNNYKGIIIAHGTDTLAYTSSLLSLILSKIDIPVFLVSSNLPLYNEKANGNTNFKAAVELICNESITSGVYVTYRNDDGIVYLHKACHLTQCLNYSDNFYSNDSIEVNKYTKDITEKATHPIDLQSLKNLKNDVIYVNPYVGMDYSWININDSIRAIIHGLYHSETACVEIKASNGQYTSNSILYLLDKCSEMNIPVIVEPCQEDTSLYVSGSQMVENGAIPIYGMTSEMVYVKSLVAGALGYRKNELIDFLKKDVCGEIIKEK